jgi:hypothetical protein
MGGSSPKPDHRCSACTVALPGPLAEKPFPDTLVSDKIRSFVGLQAADDPFVPLTLIMRLNVEA